jgi:hypothetical protein
MTKAVIKFDENIQYAGWELEELTQDLIRAKKAPVLTREEQYRRALELFSQTDSECPYGKLKHNDLPCIIDKYKECPECKCDYFLTQAKVGDSNA